MEIHNGDFWTLSLLAFLMCTISSADHIPQEDNAIKVIVSKSASASTRPPYYDKASRARYIVHKANWGVITTVSSKPEILGRAFPGPESVSDGPVGNASGTPYFYMSGMGSIMTDVAKNPNVTLTFSEAEFSDIHDCLPTSNSDPENPLCSRLMLIGKIAHVTNTEELAFAKSALFSRHPLMASWPSSHHFEFVKLNIEKIWMLDFYGPGSMLSVKDYYNAKP